MSLPGGARRLFSHYAAEDVDLERNRFFLVARLLEDGDEADLAWLNRAVPEAEVAGWFARHGGRQLSTRSREFWQVVLGCEPSPAVPETKALWPL